MKDQHRNPCPYCGRPIEDEEPWGRTVDGLRLAHKTCIWREAELAEEAKGKAV